MEKIKLFVHKRRSGATTDLLINANKNNGIVICPTRNRAESTLALARRLELPNVSVYAMDNHNFRSIHKPIYIDNFEYFIEQYLMDKGILADVEEINISTEFLENSSRVSGRKKNLM